MREGEVMKTAINMFCFLFIVLGIINFACFFAETDKLGGDALNGYQKNGKYYVCGGSITTEVTEQEWEYNKVHAISLFITHPLAMASFAYIMVRYVLPMYKDIKKT